MFRVTVVSAGISTSICLVLFLLTWSAGWMPRIVILVNSLGLFVALLASGWCTLKQRQHLLQIAVEQFEKDLPQLLVTHRGQWVAYHGRERLGFGTSKTGLLVKFEEEYSYKNLYIRKVQPEMEEAHQRW